jgi:hypothetical protein
MQPASVPADLGQSNLELLCTRILNRLSGQLQELDIAVYGQGVVLSGRARSYNVKQLAQHAVLDELAMPLLCNDIDVC